MHAGKRWHIIGEIQDNSQSGHLSRRAKQLDISRKQLSVSARGAAFIHT
jgi:hypothetical protein